MLNIDSNITFAISPNSYTSYIIFSINERYVIVFNGQSDNNFLLLVRLAFSGCLTATCLIFAEASLLMI